MILQKSFAGSVTYDAQLVVCGSEMINSLELAEDRNRWGNSRLIDRFRDEAESPHDLVRMYLASFCGEMTITCCDETGITKAEIAVFCTGNDGRPKMMPFEEVIPRKSEISCITIQIRPNYGALDVHPDRLQNTLSFSGMRNGVLCFESGAFGLEIVPILKEPTWPPLPPYLYRVRETEPAFPSR